MCMSQQFLDHNALGKQEKKNSVTSMLVGCTMQFGCFYFRSQEQNAMEKQCRAVTTRHYTHF